MNRNFGIAASLFGGAGVLLGAFGAHALRAHIDAAALQIWHTAVEYQLGHALALLAVAALAPQSPSREWKIPGTCFCIGTSLFSGSLYALALGAPPWCGAITPVGGLLLMGGWLTLGLAFWRSAKNADGLH